MLRTTPGYSKQEARRHVHWGWIKCYCVSLYSLPSKEGLLFHPKHWANHVPHGSQQCLPKEDLRLRGTWALSPHNVRVI